MTSENEKPLKPYYVYELIDSGSGKVFYVGKGKGERAYQHEKEAESLDSETPKLERIREIKSSGNEVVTRVIGRYDTEKEAFAVESTLIHWVYGFDYLTNLTGGHGRASIREKGENGRIEGIDIPEKVRSFDGSYSKEHSDLREKNNILAYMEGLKTFLENRLDLLLSDLDVSNPRFTKFYYHINGLNISLGTSHSPKKLVWIGVEALDGTQENRNRVIELCTKSNLEVRNNGAYAKLPGYKSTSSFDEIIKYFNIITEEVMSSVIA